MGLQSKGWFSGSSGSEKPYLGLRVLEFTFRSAEMHGCHTLCLVMLGVLSKSYPFSFSMSYRVAAERKKFSRDRNRECSLVNASRVAAPFVPNLHPPNVVQMIIVGTRNHPRSSRRARPVAVWQSDTCE